MKFVRYALSTLAVTGAMVLAGCSADPTAPQPTQVAQGPTANGFLDDLLGNTLRALNLVRCTPQPTSTASKVIGPGGGFIQVGAHSLVIPPGALSSNKTITAVAPSGNVNKVQLYPHGLQFNKNVYLTINYDNCEGLGSLLPKRVAYVDSGLNLLEWLLSLDNFWTNDVTARTDHFSDFVLAW